MNIKVKDKVYLKKDLICGLPTGLTTISKGTEAEITYVDNNIIGIIIGLLPVNSITYEFISSIILFFKSVRLKLSFSNSELNFVIV